MPAALEEDYEIWGPVNIIYYPLPGDLTLTSEVMNPATLQGLMMGGSSARTMRTIDVKRDYSQTLILSMASPLSCLRAVNGADIELSQNETYRVLLAAEYSQLDLINTSSPPVTPPADIFGPEPEHTWCYYFEKADLARQQGDWNEAAWMGDEASRLDLRPNDWSEYLPILEGYVHTGQDDKARSLVPIIKELPYVRYRYCENLISKMEVADQAADMSEGNQFLLENLCN
jgi:hypothetical protein